MSQWTSFSFTKPLIARFFFRQFHLAVVSTWRSTLHVQWSCWGWWRIQSQLVITSQTHSIYILTALSVGKIGCSSFCLLCTVSAADGWIDGPTAASLQVVGRSLARVNFTDRNVNVVSASNTAAASALSSAFSLSCCHVIVSLRQSCNNSQLITNTN